jgi:hypothetical protein
LKQKKIGHIGFKKKKAFRSVKKLNKKVERTKKVIFSGPVYVLYVTKSTQSKVVGALRAPTNNNKNTYTYVQQMSEIITFYITSVSTWKVTIFKVDRSGENLVKFHVAHSSPKLYGPGCLMEF